MKDNTKKFLIFSAAGTGILVAGLLIGYLAFGGFGRFAGDNFRFSRMHGGEMNAFQDNQRGRMGGRENWFSDRGGMKQGIFMRGNNDRRMSFIANELDLSKDQQDKIEDIMNDLHGKTYDLVKLHRNSMEEAISLLDKKSVTKDDVKNVIDKNSVQRDEMAVYYSEKIAEILNILTDEQKKEAKKILEKTGCGINCF